MTGFAVPGRARTVAGAAGMTGFAVPGRTRTVAGAPR